MKNQFIWHKQQTGFLLLILFWFLTACSSSEPVQPTVTTDSIPATSTATPTPTNVPQESESDSPAPSDQTIALTELTSYIIPERSGLNHVAWSPTEMKLATIQIGQVDIWQISVADDEWQNLQSWSVPTDKLMLNVAWSQDGRYLLASSKNNVWMWDVESGDLLRELPHEYGARSFTWSPDGTILATSSNDGNVRLWDTTTWEVQSTLVSIQDTIRDVAWSPNGQFIATPEKSDIHIWDATNGELIRTLAGHDDFVGNVYWSPDSQWLASNSDDQTIRIWEPNTGAIIHTLSHEGAVLIGDWSPDGSLIASGDLTGMIHLWNPQNGHSVAMVQGYDGAIDDIGWSYDGTLLATTNYGLDASVLKVWQVGEE